MIDWTKPVRTKGGKLAVRILSTTANGVYPVVGHLKNSNGLDRWTLDGEFASRTSPYLDLENVPEDSPHRYPALVIDVEIVCPKCGIHHIDAPELEKGWTNPPHHMHLCHVCGNLWEADHVRLRSRVCTNGVSPVIRET